MQKTFLLPVLAAAIMTGCSSAPKQSASTCEPGTAATAGYVAGDDKSITMTGAGGLLHAGYWKSEHAAAHPCDTQVMVAAGTSAGGEAAAGGVEGGAAEGSVRLDARVLFDFDSALLTDSGKVELDLLINDISAMTIVEQIMVIGHTDSVGSKSYNQMLSERRAISVRDYMATKLAAMDIKAEGRGEEEPIADNATAEGRAKNRRVEVIVDGSMEAQMREATAPVIDKMAAMIRKLTN
ncbi:MAG: OmpA family protein [Granulosicoccaceae bacterium]